MALSSKQDKNQHSLKKVKNVIVRNLLCAPKEDDWPRLPDKETEVLKTELKKHLVQLKVPRLKRPWREMRKFNKEKRKALAKEFDDNLPPEVHKTKTAARQMRSWLFIGINAVSRAIESDSVSCCLLAEDVTPAILVKHVVQLAVHAKVPVFLINGFKKFCKEAMGISCIALGFAKPSTLSGETNQLGDVCRLVENFFSEWQTKGYPTNDVDSCEPVFNDAPPAGKQHTTTQTTATVTTADAQESCDFLSSPSSFHLIRRSKYERAFTPDAPTDNDVPETIPPTDTGSPKKSLAKNRMKYKLPTILRVRNNPFKLKRKKKKKKVA